MRVISLLVTMLYFIPLPVDAQVANAGPDVELCGTDYQMFANAAVAPATGQWTYVAGCGTILDAANPTSMVAGLCPGVNMWRWTITNGAMVTSDDVIITVYDDQAPVADAGADITITAPQSSVQLQGSPVPVLPMFCNWTIVAGTGTIANPNDPFSMASSLNVGDNIFVWTCDNGPCGITSDVVTISMMLSSGIDRQAADLNWLQYDPIAQQLSLNTGDSIDQMTVQDISGRVVRDLNNASRSFSVADQPVGVYIAKALVNGTTHVLRFVVQ